MKKSTQHMNNQRARGFTLIELLVVIAIIGVLSSVVLAGLNSARSKAADAKRFADLREVQKGIEAYNADFGHYPITSGTHFYSACSTAAFTNQTPDNVVPGLVPTYIGGIPTGPNMNASAGIDCYAYESTANGLNYKFMDYSPVGKTPTGILNDPNYSGVAWSVYSPGGALTL